MAKFFVSFFRNIRNKKVAKIIDGGKVLDIGCGNDYFLLKRVKNKIEKGYGIDEKVQSVKEGNIITTRSSVKGKLPFDSGEFDYVTMVAFIEHITKPDDIMKECNRVLKKGGKIIITTPMGRARKIWETMVKLGLTDEESVKNHEHYFSPEELRLLLERNNFKVIEEEKFELGMNFLIIGKKL